MKKAILDIKTRSDGHLMIRCPHCNSWDRSIAEEWRKKWEKAILREYYDRIDKYPGDVSIPKAKL